MSKWMFALVMLGMITVTRPVINGLAGNQRYSTGPVVMDGDPPAPPVTTPLPPTSAFE